MWIYLRLIVLKKVFKAGLLTSVLFASPWVIAQQSLSLNQAINRAWADDDWLIASEQRENALLQESVLSGQLPDPRMSVSLANLPLDTFDFNQEPMTQFKIGFSQMFPSGDTLNLKQQQKIQQSEINPFLREERKAKLKLQISHYWLNIYFAQESIALINNDRGLFEQLVEITDTRYRTAAGAARQQDVVRAELELTRLEDRLATLQQNLDSNKQQLAQWLPYDWVILPVDTQLPELDQEIIELENLARAAVEFSDHPRILALDKNIDVALTNVELAKQSYKPGFSVGANYGFRDNTPMGLDRADFISLEVSFDLPFFTEKRQKPKVEAATYSAAAIKTERTLLFRELFAGYQQAKAQLSVLEQRQVLFEDALLPQMSDLTEATLTAYTADAGDFEEVMRAYIAELNATIEYLSISVQRQKLHATIAYLSTESKEI